MARNEKKEPYVEPPKTKEEIRAMWFDMIGMFSAVVIFFGLFFWLAFNM